MYGQTINTQHNDSSLHLRFFSIDYNKTFTFYCYFKGKYNVQNQMNKRNTEKKTKTITKPMHFTEEKPQSVPIALFDCIAETSQKYILKCA